MSVRKVSDCKVSVCRVSAHQVSEASDAKVSPRKVTFQHLAASFFQVSRKRRGGPKR